MTREERNTQREAHVLAICLENEVDWEWRGRRGYAQYAHPRKGEAAVVTLPPVKGQMTYFVALHELGHVLSPGNRYMRQLEREADAWRWAFANSEEEPTQATLRGVKRRLAGYLARAIRRGFYVPPQDSDFYRFVEWLQRVTS